MVCGQSSIDLLEVIVCPCKPCFLQVFLARVPTGGAIIRPREENLQSVNKFTLLDPINIFIYRNLISLMPIQLPPEGYDPQRETGKSTSDPNAEPIDQLYTDIEAEFKYIIDSLKVQANTEYDLQQHTEGELSSYHKGYSKALMHCADLLSYAWREFKIKHDKK
jgi:hypothetical protein